MNLVSEGVNLSKRRPAQLPYLISSKLRPKVFLWKPLRNNFAYTASAAASTTFAPVIVNNSTMECSSATRTIWKKPKLTLFQSQRKRRNNSYLTIRSSYKTSTSCSLFRTLRWISTKRSNLWWNETIDNIPIILWRLILYFEFESWTSTRCCFSETTNTVRQVSAKNTTIRYSVNPNHLPLRFSSSKSHVGLITQLCSLSTDLSTQWEVTFTELLGLVPTSTTPSILT